VLPTATNWEARPAAVVRRGPRISMADADPTASPIIGFINSLQEAIQESPAAKFKAKLAKLQAGDYDVEVTKAKLSAQINDTPCIMYSFTT